MISSVLKRNICTVVLLFSKYTCPDSFKYITEKFQICGTKFRKMSALIILISLHVNAVVRLSCIRVEVLVEKINPIVPYLPELCNLFET